MSFFNTGQIFLPSQSDCPYTASKLHLDPLATNMSRTFSTAVQKLKSLSWSNRGTTQDVAWVKQYAENAVDLVPQLLDKVDSATVQ